MQTLLLLRPDEFGPITKKLTEAPSEQRLQHLLGGPVARVPDFDTLEYDGEVYACIAFCSSGKRKHRPRVNAYATMLWNHARRRNGCNSRSGSLAGPVAVIFRT